MGGGTNFSRDHATIEWPSRGEMVAVALCGTVGRDEVEGEERERTGHFCTLTKLGEK